MQAVGSVLKMQARSASKQCASAKQIAQHLSVITFTIYKWLERKKMPAHKVIRLWRFKISEIDNWVESGEAKEKPNAFGNAE